MKLDTRFKLLRKDYARIRDDNKTIDQIWSKNDISLEDRIAICINNKYYDNLKKITTEELNDLLVKCKNDNFNNFWDIICIMYAKNDYSLIPNLENDDMERYLVVNEEMFIPSLAFIFMWAKYSNINYDKSISSIDKVLEKKPKSFINAIENDDIVKEGFLSYIKENPNSYYLSYIISSNPLLEEYFCKDHPELYFDIVYNIKNSQNISEWRNYYLKANLLKYLKGENRFLMIYYTSSLDNIEGNEEILSVFQSLFNLDEDEALYVKSIFNSIYKEYLLRTNEKEPGFIRKVIDLEKKCNIRNIIQLVYRYKNSPFIEELLAFDTETLTQEEYSAFINKLNELLSKPRLKELNSVDMLTNKSIKELEKGGYEISKESVNNDYIRNPWAHEDVNIFGFFKTIIKIYPDGNIQEKSSPSAPHLYLLNKVNQDEPELNESQAEGTIMFAMALKGRCTILTEGNSLSIIMPNQDVLTLEQIDTIKRLLESIKIPNIIITYGFVITDSTIEEYATDKVETVLEVLETIYNQKKMSQKI